MCSACLRWAPIAVYSIYPSSLGGPKGVQLRRERNNSVEHYVLSIHPISQRLAIRLRVKRFVCDQFV